MYCPLSKLWLVFIQCVALAFCTITVATALLCPLILVCLFHQHRPHYTVHKGIWYTTPLSMCFCGPFTLVSRHLSHNFFLFLCFSANVSASFTELYICNSIHKVGCLSLSPLVAVPPVFPRPHCCDELLWIAILSEGPPLLPDLPFCRSSLLSTSRL